jgi:hypothetical protein
VRRYSLVALSVGLARENCGGIRLSFGFEAKEILFTNKELCGNCVLSSKIRIKTIKLDLKCT